jgi:hypothetical protein
MRDSLVQCYKENCEPSCRALTRFLAKSIAIDLAKNC